MISLGWVGSVLRITPCACAGANQWENPTNPTKRRNEHVDDPSRARPNRPNAQSRAPSTTTGTTPCPDTSATPHVHLERTATVTPSDVSLHVLGSTRSERGCRTETDRSATSRCTDRHGATCPAQSTATNADATSARPEPGTDTAFDHRGWGHPLGRRPTSVDRLQSSPLSSSISASAAGVGVPTPNRLAPPRDRLLLKPCIDDSPIFRRTR